MDFTDDMANIFDMTHGGAIFSLIDEAFEYHVILTAQWLLL